MRRQIATGGWIEFDDVGQGRPVVLLHAFPLSRLMWRPQIDDLSKDYRLLAPDFPGFGGSDGFPGAPSIAGMADAVAGLLHALKISKPVILGGLSMGGYAALVFAHRYPGRLHALMLADTRAEGDTAEGKANREKMIAFAQEHTAEEVFNQLLPKLVSEETQTYRSAVVTELRRIAAAQTTKAIRAALQALRDRPDATPWLRDIRVPTLVIVGSQDGVTPPAAAQTLVDRIPDARLATLSGAGHLSNLEQSELFNVALRDFLNNVV
jgi:pimeloyl-ACP methyl ester carboxylesterase